jgi:hypothetical protein
MAIPINYLNELSEEEAMEFIKADKREISEATRKLLNASEKIKLKLIISSP